MSTLIPPLHVYFTCLLSTMISPVYCTQRFHLSTLIQPVHIDPICPHQFHLSTVYIDSTCPLSTLIPPVYLHTWLPLFPLTFSRKIECSSRDMTILFPQLLYTNIYIYIYQLTLVYHSQLICGFVQSQHSSKT